jgi:hypothetical protein
MDVLAAVHVQGGIVVLDACRDNGLRRMSPSANTKGFTLSDGAAAF